MNFCILIFLLCLISLINIRKHILMVLISLEFIVLVLMIVSVIFCLSINMFYIFVLFMTLFVCEGVLGLSLLVNMIRCHSNDYLNSMFMW